MEGEKFEVFYPMLQEKSAFEIFDVTSSKKHFLFKYCANYHALQISDGIIAITQIFECRKSEFGPSDRRHYREH